MLENVRLIDILGYYSSVDKNVLQLY